MLKIVCCVLLLYVDVMDGRSLQGAHLWRWFQYYPHYSHQWSCRVSIIVELFMKSSMQKLNYRAFTCTSVWFKGHPKCHWPQAKVTILCCCWWLQKHNGGYHKGEILHIQYVFVLKINGSHARKSSSSRQ